MRCKTARGANVSTPGGVNPHPNLLLDADRADLDTAWREREAEAKELNDKGHYSMAIAIRLYALEIRLKVIICKHLKLDFLPKVCKTHDLAELIIFTGLRAELDDPVRVAIRQNFDRLAIFSKQKLNDLRYLPKG